MLIILTLLSFEMMPQIVANVLLPSAIVLVLCCNSVLAFHSVTSFRTSEKVNNQKYFSPPSSSCVLPNTSRSLQLSSKEKNENDGNDESAGLKRKAEQLREEIRALEEILQSSDRRRTTPTNVILSAATRKDEEESCSLRGKTVLVVGANGRLGSMVCRYLLRNNPKTQVVAAVHYVGYVCNNQRRFMEWIPKFVPNPILDLPLYTRTTSSLHIIGRQLHVDMADYPMKLEQRMGKAL